MKYVTFILTFLLLLALNGPGADNIPTSDPSGDWLGALSLGHVKLRIVLRIARANETFTGTLDSIDQGVKGIPISTIEFQRPAVKVRLKSIAADFDGTLSDDGSEIIGQWNQGGQSSPIVFKRAEKPLVIIRPQEPKKPYPYREELVTVVNSDARVNLGGTLTLPEKGGPFPATVLITGSGLHDRNESLMGHQPFLLLADFLTRQGIAVLRLDDRGVGGSTGSKMTSTDDDLAGDICAAVALLKQRGDINPQHIGLIGHSEGGLIAPLAAARTPDVAFIVLMAGPGVPLDQLLQRQVADISRANGLDEALIARVCELQGRVFDALKGQPNNQLAEKTILGIWDEAIKNSTPEERTKLGLSDVGNSSQYKVMFTPWFRHILAYDPKPALMKTHCAVLAINGAKDRQVSSGENLAAIAAALKAGGNANFQTVELPGLNHLFQTCKTGLPAEYGEIEETISPSALKLMGDWIRQQATGSR